MEKLMDPKQQNLTVFVPLPKVCRSPMRRCRSGVEMLRDAVTPIVHNPCSTLATIILVVVEGVFIFLLLLLDVSIQDSFRTLNCWNGTENFVGLQLSIGEIEYDLKRPMQCTSTVLLCAFLMEVMVRGFVSGRRLLRNYWEVFDACVAVTAFSVQVALLTSFSIGKQVSLFLILFRLWRILELMGTPLSKQSSCFFNDAHMGNVLSASSSITTADTYVAEQSVATLMLKIEELEREIDRLHAERRNQPVQIHPRRHGLSDALLQQEFETVQSQPINRRSLPEVSAKITNDANNESASSKCQRCINHNWTTDDLLRMACFQLSRSDSKFRDDLRAAKSLEELNLPESGYSSAQRRFHGGSGSRYPKLPGATIGHHDQSVMTPLQLAVHLEAMVSRQGSKLKDSGKNPYEWYMELSEIKRISQVNCPDFSQSDQHIPVTTL